MGCRIQELVFALCLTLAVLRAAAAAAPVVEVANSEELRAAFDALKTSGGTILLLKDIQVATADWPMAVIPIKGCVCVCAEEGVLA